MYSKFIATDIRLVASQLYRKAFTQPQVMCRSYIIPLFGVDLKGCINRTRAKERKGSIT
jgi:hypothetical protein